MGGWSPGWLVGLLSESLWIELLPQFVTSCSETWYAESALSVDVPDVFRAARFTAFRVICLWTNMCGRDI